MRKIVGTLVLASLLFIGAELGVTFLVEAAMGRAWRKGTGVKGVFHLHSFPAVVSLARGRWREALGSWEGSLSGEGQTPSGCREKVEVVYRGSLRLRDFRWDVGDAIFGRPPRVGEMGEAMLTTALQLEDLLGSVPGGEVGAPGTSAGSEGMGTAFEFFVEDGALTLYRKDLDPGSRSGQINDLNRSLRMMLVWKPEPPLPGCRLRGAREDGGDLVLVWDLVPDGSVGGSLKDGFMEVETS